MGKRKSMLLFALAIFFLAGCGKSDEKESIDKIYLYYINSGENKVVHQEYEVKSSQEVDIVNEMVKALQHKPKDVSNKKTIPDNVTIPTVDFLGNGKIRLNFDATYNQLTGIQELLRRAAIVKTLCQFPFVSSMEFYVEGNPMTDPDGQQIGPMTKSSFIENFNYMEKQSIVLYYANKENSQLVGVDAMANYDASSTLEYIVIEQLIKGTQGIKKLEEYYDQELNGTIPEGTRCNSINTIDYTCYVDLNNEFLKGAKGSIQDELAVYSIVNSLTSLPTINKVKFTIDGESIPVFGAVKNFDQYFEMNYNLVQKSVENVSQN